MFDTPSSKPVESQPIMASAEHLRAEAPKLVPLAAATIASEEALQTATTGTPKNLSQAWSILCEEKQIDDGAPVIDTLVELGVRSERDLDELDEADINNISEKLRKIQRKKFLRFLGIATD